MFCEDGSWSTHLSYQAHQPPTLLEQAPRSLASTQVDTDVVYDDQTSSSQRCFDLVYGPAEALVSLDEGSEAVDMREHSSLPLCRQLHALQEGGGARARVSSRDL